MEQTPLIKGHSKSLEMAKNYLGKIVTITIDQPLGTTYKGILYGCNYGFVPSTQAPDGMELDAYFLSSNKPLENATGRCIAIIHRLEDDDDKLILVNDGTVLSDDEIEQEVHFMEQYHKHEIVR